MVRNGWREIRTLLWALLLAFAVWVAAVSATDPNEERAYPTRIQLVVEGQDPNTVLGGSLPADVGVVLRAPASVWRRLNAEPSAIHATVDLAGAGTGSYHTNIQVSVDMGPASVITVSPASVDVVLEARTARALAPTSDISGEPATGYQAGGVEISPKVVRVTGAASAVQRVVKVRAPIVIAGVRESIERDVSPVAVDESGLPVAGVVLSPSSVHISIPLIRQTGYRDMAVKVAVRGQVAKGYRLDSIQVFPPVVTVYSPEPELVNSLPGVVETQPVNLDGVSANTGLNISLDLPTGVTIVGAQTVYVQAGVSPLLGTITLADQEVQVQGLAAGLEASVPEAGPDVILSGPMAVLNALTKRDVAVTVDVSGLAAGTYQLTPTIRILKSGVSVESVLPATLEIVLAVPATPTRKP